MNTSSSNFTFFINEFKHNTEFRALVICIPLLAVILLFVPSHKPSVNIESVKLQIAELKIKKLERKVSALIQYDEERQADYNEMLKKENKTIFPRVDYYCPDVYGAQGLYNICTQEKNELSRLQQLLK